MSSSGWWGEATTDEGVVSLRVARRADGVRLVVDGPTGTVDVEVPAHLADELASALHAALDRGVDPGVEPGPPESDRSDHSDPARPWSEPLPGAAEIAPARDAALEVLRALAAELPETAEVEALGAPTFRVSTRSFAVVEVADGCPVVRVKVSITDQERLLADDRYRRDEETGGHGWTSLRIDTLDAEELRSLLVTGYRFVAPEHLTAQIRT